MPLDLEFHVTIGGTNVTSDTIEWSLEDTEDGISAIEVTVASPDLRYAGKFSSEDEVALSWGSQGQMLGPVEFLIRKIRERQSVAGSTVTVIALDWTEKLSGLNVRGMFDEDMDTNKIAEELYGKLKMQLNNKAKPGERAKDNQVAAPGTSANQFLRNNVELRSGKSQQAQKKPYKDLKEANKETSSLGGGAKIEKGPHLTGGFTKGIREKVEAEMANRTAEENLLDNQTDHAGSLSIRAQLDIVDYPFICAKKCLTILGVGPAASGIWYVQTVNHRWDSSAGYRAQCDLMRIDTKKDKANTPQSGSGGGSGHGGTASAEASQWADATAAAGLSEGEKPDQTGAPIVRYAEIFQKNVVYMGPRKLDAASQKTFTCGDGKHVTEFEYTLDVQSPKDVGEQAKLEDKAPNMPSLYKEAADQYANLTAPV